MPRRETYRLPRRTVTLPEDLTPAMRADWYAADPKTNDRIIDATWEMLKRHRLRGHDHGSDDVPPRRH